MVILCLEIVRNFSSAHWAGRLVLEVSSHALDTKTVTARQDAWFNHEIVAQAAISLNVFSLLLVMFLNNLVNMITNEFECFVSYIFIFGLAIFKELSVHIFSMFPHHFSVFISGQGLGFAVGVEEYNLSFDPVPRFYALSFPFLADLRCDNVFKMIVTSSDTFSYSDELFPFMVSYICFSMAFLKAFLNSFLLILKNWRLFCSLI